MNILESLRKIENKIYREQDRSIDLQGMYLKEDVDKDKLWEMITNNDVDGVIKMIEGMYESEERIAGYPWASFIKNIENNTNYLVDSAYRDTPQQWIELIDKDTNEVFDAEVTQYSDGEFELMLYNVTAKDLGDYQDSWDVDESLNEDWASEVDYYADKISDYVSKNRNNYNRVCDYVDKFLNKPNVNFGDLELVDLKKIYNKFIDESIVEKLSPMEGQVIAKALVNANDEQAIKDIIDELYQYDKNYYDEFYKLIEQGYNAISAASVISDELMQMGESLNEATDFKNFIYNNLLDAVDSAEPRLITDYMVKCSKSAIPNALYYVNKGEDVVLRLGNMKDPVKGVVSHVWVEHNGDIAQTFGSNVNQKFIDTYATKDKLHPYISIALVPGDVEASKEKIKNKLSKITNSGATPAQSQSAWKNTLAKYWNRINESLNGDAESSPKYHFYEYDGSVNFKDGSFEKFKEKTTAKSPEQALNYIKAKFCKKKYGDVIKSKLSQFTLDKSSLKEINNDSIEDEKQLSIFDIMGK